FQRGRDGPPAQLDRGQRGQGPAEPPDGRPGPGTDHRLGSLEHGWYPLCPTSSESTARGRPASGGRGRLSTRPRHAERYVQEWAAAQAAAGYLAYDPASGRFHLTEEQAFALADPDGPPSLPGASSSPWPASGPSRASPRPSAPA